MFESTLVFFGSYDFATGTEVYETRKPCRTPFDPHASRCSHSFPDRTIPKN